MNGMSTLPKVILKLEQFEGPYDLLLELVRDKRMDISSVSLSQVTNTFLTHIRTGQINPDLMADFLVVASTLLLIKIRSALPQIGAEEEEEIIELTDRIRVYDLYRRQAQQMQSQWGAWRLLPAHFWADERAAVHSISSWPNVTAQDLQRWFSDFLTHMPKPPQPTAHLITRGRTLCESLELFHQRLHTAKQFLFQDVVADTSPQDTAVSFLAALELARQQVVGLHQGKHFDTIEITKL